MPDQLENPIDAGNNDGTGTVIGLLSADADVEGVAPLVDRLAEQGVRTERLGADGLVEGQPVIVVLSDHLVETLSGLGAAKALLESRGSELLPVTLTAQPYHDLLDDRSQIPLAAQGVDRAARLIVPVARLGADAIMGWNHTAARAARWEANGKRRSELMTRQELGRAEDLLREPVSSIAGVDATGVRALVNATRDNLKRVRRQRLIAVVIALCLVIASGIVALTQKFRADAAAQYASEQADAAESDRLADLASQVMYTDPDLPWILADRAVRLAQRPRSLAVAQQVVDNLVPHSTYDLPAVATSVVALEPDSLAIGLADDAGFQVRVRSTGEVLFEQKGDDGSGDVLLSVDQTGTRFLASSDGASYLVDPSANDGVVRVGGSRVISDPGVWLDEGHVLVVSDGALYIVDTSTGAMAALAVPPSDGAGDVVCVASDAARTWVALAYEDRVDVWKLTASGEGYSLDPTRLASIDQEGTASMIVDDKAKQLVLSDGQTPTNIDEPGLFESGALETMKVAGNGGSMVVDKHGAIYTGRSGGIIMLTVPNNTPGGARDSVLSLRAHVDDVIGLGMWQDGSWVSTGLDLKLRVWHEPILPEAFNGDLAPGMLTSMAGRPGLEDTYRCTLGSSGEHGTTTGIMLDGSAVITISNDSFATDQVLKLWPDTIIPGKVGHSDPDTVYRLRGNGDQPGNIQMIPLDEPDSARYVGTGVGGALLNYSLFSVSSNGEYVAVTVAQGAYRGLTGIWGKESDGVILSDTSISDGDAVYIGAFNDGSAVTISEAGTVKWVEKSVNNSHDVLFETPTTVRAALATRDRTYYTVTDAGEVRVWTQDTKSRLVGTIPPTLKPMAMSLSPSGALLAIIGTQGTRVVAVDSGQTVAVLDPADIIAGTSPVHDVVFADDDSTMTVIRSNGWIERLPLHLGETMNQALSNNVPRSLTSNEEAAIDE